MKTLEYRVDVDNKNLPGALEMEEGIIYYSPIFNASIHLCPCGCGHPTYLPYNVSENYEGGNGIRTLIWNVPNEILTISPSIQVVGGCCSHYHITQNKVIV